MLFIRDESGKPGVLLAVHDDLPDDLVHLPSDRPLPLLAPPLLQVYL
jgi:hypothetical protein